MFSETLLKGKVALVTGSSSGIGFGIAQALYHAGADIILHGANSLPEGQEIADALRKTRSGGQISFIQADLSTPLGCRELIKKSLDVKDRIDILVNNAGIQHVSPIETFNPSEWDRVIAINLTAPFLLIQGLLPMMRTQNWGRIINIASAHGHVASENKSAYVSSKHGLVGLTKVVGLETAQTGITCNAICPGWVLTPLVQKQIDAIAENHHLNNEEAKKKLLSEKQPSQEFATPEQIGGLAVFLCSDYASQITGSSQSIDGGWLAR